MANYSRSLLQLCECLRGSVPKHADWTSLLGLANQTLTTPALMDFVTRCKDQIPEDVCLYVREIFERNVMRNDRLATQLAETVAAINDRCVTPMLFKGAATLATTARPHWGSKLMADLDIMVLPEQIEATMKALAAIGYSVHYQSRPDDERWHADLKRPSDVGMVDLQLEPPGHPFFYKMTDNVARLCKMTPIGRGSCLIPTPTCQALMLIMHDEFQDYGYWMGNIDLRHLVEMRDLAVSAQGIDWEMLAALTPSNLARNALETHLVALSSLLGVDVPTHMRNGFIARLQHRRRLAQAKFPPLRRLLLPLAVLDHRNYLDGPGASNGQKITASRAWRFPKAGTLRFLMRLSRARRVGKV
jgi:putative nucleotidyltransferase-like protein